MEKIVLPMAEVVIGCIGWTGGTIAAAGAGWTWTGDIPAATGLLGNEGGAGFGGGPTVTDEKFAPEIICQLFMDTVSFSSYDFIKRITSDSENNTAENLLNKNNTVQRKVEHVQATIIQKLCNKSYMNS